MFRRIPLMQQADAAGGGAAAGAAGGAAAGAGAGAGAAADKNGQQQQAGQQSKSQDGASSSQAGAQQQTDQGKQATDAAKGAGADKAKPGDQAQIAIKLPAGAEANPLAVTAGEHYGSWAKSKGLSQEHAQAAFDYFVERSKESEGALQKQIVQDIDALKADKEFGGAKYDKTLAARDSALKQFFGDDVAKLFKDLGIDTNPGVAKGLARIRALLSEDQIGDKGGNPPPAMNTREAELRKMFPNSYDAMVGKKKTA